MHKEYILGLLFMIAINVNAKSQTSDQDFWSNTRVELAGTYDALNSSVGFITKGKKELFTAKKFKGYAGIALQYAYQNETDRMMKQGVTGDNNDLGFYAVFDFEHYYFKSKKFFTGLEPFIGVTSLRSKGTLNLAAFDVRERYVNNYTYLNYGVTSKLGYKFGRFQPNIFFMIPLKGLFDNGRNRIGGMDSRILLGACVSYSIKASK